MNKKLSTVVKNFYFKGLEDENIIMEATSNTFGGVCQKASQNDDINNHIDFWWSGNNKNGKTYGVDAKGLKKNNRKDKVYDDSIQWIELKNVQGKDGWIYGSADFIAFRTNTDIIYVKRKDIVTYSENKIKGKEISYGINPNEFYIPYQRSGRLDLIFKAPTSDMRELAVAIIKLN